MRQLTRQAAVCDDLLDVLNGAQTLVDMRASAERVHRALAMAIADKERAAMGALATPRAPTTLQIQTANEVAERLRALEPAFDMRIHALATRGTGLRVADVMSVIAGATMFVIRSPDYATVSCLDNTDFMFEDPLEPLGYFQGGPDEDDIVGVGTGGDAWYVANRTTLAALGGIPPPTP